MTNYNNRNSNQRNPSREWDNEYDQDRNRSFDNDRNDDNNRRERNWGGRNYSSDFNDRNQYGSESGWNNDRQFNQRNSWSDDRNTGNFQGGDRGLNRQRGDSWNTDDLRSNDFNNRNSNDFNRSGNYGNSNYDYNRGSSGYGFGSFDDNNRNRNQDRGWWDRAKDEVSSWFGDDDADRRRRRDDRQQGVHKGRGPKGYTRSDERIKEDVNDRLSDDQHIDASEITVTVSGGEVVLSGSVDRRDAKRHAEDLAESVSGVKNVENRIRVNSNTTFNSTSGASTGVTGSSNVSGTGSLETKKS